MKKVQELNVIQSSYLILLLCLVFLLNSKTVGSSIYIGLIICSISLLQILLCGIGISISHTWAQKSAFFIYIILAILIILSIKSGGYESSIFISMVIGMVSAVQVIFSSIGAFVSKNITQKLIFAIHLMVSLFILMFVLFFADFYHG